MKIDCLLTPPRHCFSGILLHRVGRYGCIHRGEAGKGKVFLSCIPADRA